MVIVDRKSLSDGTSVNDHHQQLRMTDSNANSDSGNSKSHNNKSNMNDLNSVFDSPQSVNTSISSATNPTSPMSTVTPIAPGTTSDPSGNETIYELGHRSPLDSPSHVVSERVQTLASQIYNELQKIMTRCSDDEEAVSGLMPLVVNVLESLDLTLIENQQLQVELELCKLISFVDFDCAIAN